MHCWFDRSFVLLSAVLVGGLVTKPIRAEYRFETIVLSSDIAPGSGGSGPDVEFTSFPFFLPVLNSSSEVAFLAETSENADGDQFGIFSTAGGTLHAIAFEGQIAPGSGGSGADVPFTFFRGPVLNSSGEVAFHGSTEINADGGISGIFSTAGGALRTVAFEEQIAPGSGGSGADVKFTRIVAIPVINSAGDVAFVAETSMNTDGGDYGFFSTVGGSLHAIAFEGQIAPGSGGSGLDVPYFGHTTVHSSINAAGEVAFKAGTLTNADNGNEGIFSTVGGTLHSVAFERQIAPGGGGSGPDVEFRAFFRAPALNVVGEVAFLASTTSDVDGGNEGVFSTSGGELRTVASRRLIAPGSGGSGADVLFSDFTDPPVLNSQGQVAFWAQTQMNSDGGDSGIFSTAGGSLHAVAFEQQFAPGSGGSGPDVPFTSFGPPVLNASGEVTFIAETLMNIDGGDSGIFSTLDGVVEAVVFEGDKLEVASGEFRTIQEFANLSITEGQFNDLGQIVFKAVFIDGSEGIFLATPIPEPNTTVIALAASLFFFGRRWIKVRGYAHPRSKRNSPSWNLP